MIEKLQSLSSNRRNQRVNPDKAPLPKLFVYGVLVFCPLVGKSQYEDLSSAPIQSTNPYQGVSAEDMEMRRARQQAQALQGEAASVSMARSAGRSLDQQNQDRARQEARELKAMKRSIAERLKWDRANNPVQKVSSSEMNSWSPAPTPASVDREIPNTFIDSVSEAEAAAVRRGDVEQKKKRFSLNPFKKDDPVPATATPAVVSPQTYSPTTLSTAPVQEQNPQFSEPLPEKKSLFGKLKVPGFGGRDEPEVQEAVAPGPVFRSSSSASSTASVGSSSPRTEPSVADTPPPPQPAAMNSRNEAPAPQLTAFSPETEPEKEKGGLFGAFKKSDSEPEAVVPEKTKSGSGLFAFGKKKSNSDSRAIDASLFPSGAAEQAPTGGNLTGGYTADDVAEEMAEAPTNTGTVSLPGDSPEKKKFSIPKPNLSFPTLASGSKPSGSDRGSSVPTMTTINEQGTDFYVVTEMAQFMVFGEEQMQSEVTALSAGNVVRMTRPGEQWASIRLSDGREGVVQNKYLRAASSSEAGGQFAATDS